MEANATISANGGVGTSHYDGSGAGGSGGAVRIQALLLTILARFTRKVGMLSAVVLWLVRGWRANRTSFQRNDLSR